MNVNEARAEKYIKQMFGCPEETVIHRTGWPDFLVQTPLGQIIAIEYKFGGDVLSEDQRTMAWLLEEAGCPTHVLMEPMKGYFNSNRIVYQEAENRLEDKRIADELGLLFKQGRET